MPGGQRVANADDGGKEGVCKEGGGKDNLERLREKRDRLCHIVNGEDAGSDVGGKDTSGRNLSHVLERRGIRIY